MTIRTHASSWLKILLRGSLICGLCTIPGLAHHGEYRHHADDCYPHDDYCSRGTIQAQRWNSRGSTIAATEAVEGKIVEIIYLPGATSDSGMVEARLLSGGQTILVRLVPVGLLKQKRVVIREGESIAVTGYRVSGMDGDFLVATEIRNGDQAVALRDSRGRLIQ